jgi:hypothetical protein
MFALRVLTTGNKQLLCLTTRTGLVVDENSLEIKNDLSQYLGDTYNLYSFKDKKVVAEGIITPSLKPQHITEE